MIDKLSWDGQEKALDVGTGNGGCAIKVAKKFPDSTVTGIDYWGKEGSYSQKMCGNNAAIEGVGGRVRFQRSSASNLPLFLVRKLYGNIDNLLETIREWGIEDVHFTSTADIVDIPRLLRIPPMLGKIGIIYGKK